MASMNISLPDPMKDWVNAQMKTGRYSNASDYVRDLIRQDQVRAEKTRALQALIDEGLASGTTDKTMDEILTTARQRASKQATE